MIARCSESAVASAQQSSFKPGPNMITEEIPSDFKICMAGICSECILWLEHAVQLVAWAQHDYKGDTRRLEPLHGR